MIKATGFDQVEKKLKDLAEKVQELGGGGLIPFSELFPDEFVSHHTRFSSISELFDNSSFKVESQEDLAAIPDDKWDEYIRSVSDFDHWESMLSAAMEIWLAKKRGL